jgi:hypothetical protein
MYIHTQMQNENGCICSHVTNRHIHTGDMEPFSTERVKVFKSHLCSCFFREAKVVKNSLYQRTDVTSSSPSRTGRLRPSSRYALVCISTHNYAHTHTHTPVVFAERPLNLYQFSTKTWFLCMFACVHTQIYAKSIQIYQKAVSDVLRKNFIRRKEDG